MLTDPTGASDATVVVAVRAAQLEAARVRGEVAYVQAAWEGCVLSVSEGVATVLLLDLNDGQESVAQLPVSRVQAADRGALAPGALVYWLVGVNPDGIRTSCLTVRRLSGPSPDVVASWSTR